MTLPPGASQQAISFNHLRDPFQAIQTGQSKDDSGHLKREVDSIDAKSGPNNRLILCTLPGGSTSEDQEARLRARQAVLSGLIRSGFSLREHDRIGVLRLRMANHRPCTDKGTDTTNQFYLPFEWLNKKSPPERGQEPHGGDALLVWLNEAEFMDNSAARIRCLIHKLQEGPTAKGESTNIQAAACYSSIHLLGPYSSEFLRELYLSDRSTNPCASDQPLTNSTLVVALPRASMAVLGGNYQPGNPYQRSDLVKLTNTSPRLFSHVIDIGVTDDALMAGLHHEFKRRGVDLDDPSKDHVVVVSDSTTLIGRELPRQFGNFLRQRQIPKPAGPGSTGLGETRPTNLWSFSFLGGIDGRRSDKRPDSPGYGDSTEGRSGDPQSGAGWGNRALGAHQMDSLHRLAEKIQGLDSSLRVKNQGALRAVIIGGGDINDTLLILQALRPILPHALFATTELDARLWQPDQWKHCRNLLVASGYGLELAEQLQDGILPFRDSRQTALFASALVAGDTWKLGQGPCEPSGIPADLPVRPRVFEVGRHGPLDISEPTGNASPPHPPAEALKIGNPFLSFPWSYGAMGLIVVVLLLALIPSLQKLTLNRPEFLAQPLWLQPEDLGGHRGVWWLRERLGGGKEGDLEPDEKRLHTQLVKILGVGRDPEAKKKPEVKNVEIWDPVKIIPSDIVDRESVQRVFKAKRIRGLHTKANKNAKDPDIHERINGLLKVIWGKIINGDVKRSDIVEWLGKPWDRLSSATLKTSRLERDSPAKFQQQQAWILSRLIVQECFESGLRPWSASDLVSKEVVDIVDGINRQILSADFELKEESRVVRNGETLEQLKDKREKLDAVLGKCFAVQSDSDGGNRNPEEAGSSILKAALAALQTGFNLYRLRTLELWLAYGILLGLVVGLGAMAVWTLDWMFRLHGGFLSGTSIVPTLFCLVLVVAVGLFCLVQAQIQLTETILRISQGFRFCRRAYQLSGQTTKRETLDRWIQGLRNIWFPAVPHHQNPVSAQDLWGEYQERSKSWRRWCRVGTLVVVYLIATYLFLWCAGYGRMDLPALSRQFGAGLHFWLSTAALVVFIALAFWTLDAALLSMWFIRSLVQGPTRYPYSTILMIQDLRGRINERLVADYLDIKLMAAITRGIGPMLYFPGVVLLLLVVAYNPITYGWAWPASWFVAILSHFLLAVAGVVGLQRTAQWARSRTVGALEDQLLVERRGAARDVQDVREGMLGEAHNMVTEVKELREGAFVGLVGNPVIGATLMPIAGAILMAILRRWAEGEGWSVLAGLGQ